jgi:hypothetical protein
MKIFFLLLVLINLLITTEALGSKKNSEEKNCQATSVQWMKCKGQLPKGTKGSLIKIGARSNKKDECYIWVGQAEFLCDNGKWIQEKQGQTCNWDCICCY